MHVRSATLLVVVVLPVTFLLFPLALARPPEPPGIPEGAVQPTEPSVEAVGLPETAFESLDGVDSGGVIDPFTGQPKVPTYVGADGEEITPDRIRTFLERRFADGYRSRDPEVVGARYCPDCESWPYRTRLSFSRI